MHTVRRTQPSPGRLRGVRTLIAGAAATATVLSVAGLAANAQAQPVAQTAKGSDPNVAAGVATFLGLPTCASGTPAVTSSPALPASVHAVVTGLKSRLVGVFPPSPTKYTVTVTCGGGVKKTSTVTVSTPAENSAIGLGAQTQQGLVDQFTG